MIWIYKCIVTVGIYNGRFAGNVHTDNSCLAPRRVDFSVHTGGVLPHNGHLADLDTGFFLQVIKDGHLMTTLGRGVVDSTTNHAVITPR